jgi:hypothetical protein
MTDIAKGFANDGGHLLSGLVQRSRVAFEGMWEDMEAKKTRLKQEMDMSVTCYEWFAQGSYADEQNCLRMEPCEKAMTNATRAQCVHRSQ